jgi:hypothetical protein
MDIHGVRKDIAHNLFGAFASLRKLIHLNCKIHEIYHSYLVLRSLPDV